MSGGDFSLMLLGGLIGVGMCTLAAGAGAAIAHFISRPGK